MATPDTNQRSDLPVGVWAIDPARSSITVTATKLGLFRVPATLSLASATIEIDGEHHVVGVEAVVEAGSYASKNAKRNEHVRGSDFLDADDHPQLSYTAASVERSEDGYIAEGAVTVKGRTSPVTLAIADITVDGDRGSFVATATLDRNQLGIDALPSIVIGRTLQLTIAAEAVRSEATR